MPTIDELPSAVSVSDGDELMVSQSDVARKATRAQLLSGVQPALAVAQATLVGRLSAGVGSPESVGIGANLTIANGAINAPPPYLIASLAAAAPPGATDLVGVSQGGMNAAMNYATLMSGISILQGIDASGLNVAAVGAVGARTLATILSDAISIAAFGAVGDGITDDSAAFQAGLASGRVLRLDGRTYVVNGTLPVQQSAALIGIPGLTHIVRAQVSAAGPWINCSGAVLVAFGVVFDGGGLAGSDAPLISIEATCDSALLQHCAIRNAGGPTQGHGLNISGNGAGTLTLIDVLFQNNSQCGVLGAGLARLICRDSVFDGNKSSGILISDASPFRVESNCFTNNGNGFEAGNWGSAAVSTTVGSGCIATCQFTGNGGWAIAVAGNGVSVTNNTLTSNGGVSQGGGILARLSYARIDGNTICGGDTGIDARTSISLAVCNNSVNQTGVALNVGGCQNLLVSGNQLSGSGWGAVVSAIEPGLSFVPTGTITIEGNWISLSTAQGGGIRALDGVFGLSVIENDFTGSGSATVDQSLWLHTDSAIVQGNRWNNQVEFSVVAGSVAGVQTVVVPDIADRILVTSASPAIASLLTMHQAATLGQIGFVRVSAGGTGYTQAQVTISGTGTGASASAVVANGQIVWIIVSNPGSGYGAIGSVASVSILGDGVGAAATAFVGLPVVEARRLRVSCTVPLRFTITGSVPPFLTWSGFDTTVPIAGAAELEGTFGCWRVVASPPVDYVAPTGNGGVAIQSVAGGSITLRPASGGVLSIASAEEPVGCTSNVGRGAPTGQIMAPPGSDYRNLNGGAGATFWIKQSGTDASGWVAVA